MLASSEKRKPSLQPETALLYRNADVLVVYSDQRLRQFLNFHLWRAGYHVRLVGSAIGAGVLIFEAAPDVMIMDLDAKGTNCFEFVADIRAYRTIPHFPVIYLTADAVSATYANDLGAACLRKPVRPERLLTAVAASTLNLRPRSPIAQQQCLLTEINGRLRLKKISPARH